MQSPIVINKPDCKVINPLEECIKKFYVLMQELILCNFLDCIGELVSSIS